MKFGGNVLQVNMYRLTKSDFFDLTSHFQDGGHDVISCRKVLLSGECILSRRMVLHMYPLAILSTVPDP